MPTETTADRRLMGRPRDERTDRAIVSATLELIAELGIDGFRMEDVAEPGRRGQGGDLPALRLEGRLVAAAIAALVSEIELPDSGSTRDDLLALMRDAVAVYRDPLNAGVMADLVGAMRRGPSSAQAVRERFLAARRNALRAVLERGVARGDLRARPRLRAGARHARRPALLPPADHRRPARRAPRRGRDRTHPARLRALHQSKDNHDEYPRHPDRNRRDQDAAGRGQRPRRPPPAEHVPRPAVDGAAADLRVRDRASGGADRRRHRRDGPDRGARLLPALAPVLPLRPARVGRARGGDRPAADESSVSLPATCAGSC